MFTKVKMKKPVILILLCVSYGKLTAQNDPTTYFIDRMSVSSSNSRIDVNATGDTVLISEFDSKNIKNQSHQDFTKIYKGTPYFKNKWFIGQMRLKDGEVIKGNMAFNLVSNVVHFTPFYTAEATELRPEEIILGGHVLRKQKDFFSNAMDYYYEIVYHEKSLILSRPVCRYQPKSQAQTTGYEPTGDNFEGYFEKTEQLFFGSDDKLILIKSNARFYDIFGLHKKAIQSYVVDNKLNIKSKPDILKIFRYYDSLL